MAGKRQNDKDRWLPNRVYRGKYSYEWRPKNGSCQTLCKLPADRIEGEDVKRAVIQAYSEALNEDSTQNTVAHLIDLYLQSPQFKRLAPRTQKDYQRYEKRIRKVFGGMPPKDVKAPHIRAFMDKTGTENPTTSNRHHSFMSTIFAWAYERGIVDLNPATGIRKFTEKPRTRYIQLWEYDVVYQSALQSPYPYIAPMMEIAYLCRARAGEILALSEDSITDKGVYLARTKGSKDELTLWSPRLRAAVELARSMYPDVPAPITNPLFRTKKGQRISSESRKTAWQRVMNKSIKNGVLIDNQITALSDRFTFHDIKAMGVSNHSSHHSGHRSERMKDVYIRKVDEIEPTE